MRANRDLNSRFPAGSRGHGAHAIMSLPWPHGRSDLAAHRGPAPAGSGSGRRTPRVDLARPVRTRAPLPVAVIRLGGVQVGIVPLTGGRLAARPRPITEPGSKPRQRDVNQVQGDRVLSGARASARAEQLRVGTKREPPTPRAAFVRLSGLYACIEGTKRTAITCSSRPRTSHDRIAG